MGRALLGFYIDRKINGEALTMATTLYKENANGESAIMLAMAQLALNKNDEAIELLAGLGDDQRTEHSENTPRHRLGSAGTNGTKPGTSPATPSSPRTVAETSVFDAARLYALTGDKTNALKNLKCAFECTPESFLDSLKEDAKSQHRPGCDRWPRRVCQSPNDQVQSQGLRRLRQQGWMQSGQERLCRRQGQGWLR